MIKNLKDLKTKQEVLDTLRKYIQENYDLSLRKTRDEDNFSLPSWSEFQAFQLGMQKTYQKLLEFIPSSDQGEK